MISDGVATALISAISGIVVTFLTMYYRNKSLSSKNASKPKDRMDLIFEGYEKLIKEQQLEIDRKARAIEHYEKLITAHREQVDALEQEIEKLKEELREAEEARKVLLKELEDLKKKFETRLIPPGE